MNSEIQNKTQKLNLMAHMYLRKYFNPKIQEQKMLDLQYYDAIDVAIDIDRHPEQE